MPQHTSRIGSAYSAELQRHPHHMIGELAATAIWFQTIGRPLPSASLNPSFTLSGCSPSSASMASDQAISKPTESHDKAAMHARRDESSAMNYGQTVAGVPP